VHVRHFGVAYGVGFPCEDACCFPALNKSALEKVTSVTKSRTADGDTSVMSQDVESEREATDGNQYISKKARLGMKNATSDRIEGNGTVRSVLSAESANAEQMIPSHLLYRSLRGQ
jgi:hypothetical protein